MAKCKDCDYLKRVDHICGADILKCSITEWEKCPESECNIEELGYNPITEQ